MDFSFTEEQRMLKESAKRFMGERFPVEAVIDFVGWAEKADEPEVEVLEKTSWKEIADLGWLGLSVPEDRGGAGMGFVEEAVVLEELGYALYPGPYFSTVCTLEVLASDERALKRVLAGEMSASFAVESLSGGSKLEARETDDGWRLAGSTGIVPDLWEELYVVVAARAPGGTALFLIDVDEEYEGRSTRHATMDRTRTYGSLTARESDGTAARLLVGPGETDGALERLRTRALAAAAVEAVGVAQKALDLALEYAKERKQFEKAIGTYQAVSHQIADSYMGVELARSLAYWAAWCVANDDERSVEAAAAAKALASEVAVAACERSIQVHGGVGFTWEHALHRYYKRAQWLESFLGYPSQQRSEIADRILGR